MLANALEAMDKTSLLASFTGSVIVGAEGEEEVSADVRVDPELGHVVQVVGGTDEISDWPGSPRGAVA